MYCDLSEDGHTVYNDGKDFTKYCPEWKSSVLWDQWYQHGLKTFAKSLLTFLWSHEVLMLLMHLETASTPPTKDLSRTITTPIPITIGPDGCPDIPSVTISDGYKTKVVQSMLREYCTTHIRGSFTYQSIPLLTIY
jgi:hypothetical protein